VVERSANTAQTPTNRSRVSNNARVLEGVDGRSTWARRYRDLLDAHVHDLGGPDNVSEAERSIIRRAAALTVELERMEAKFAQSGERGPKADAIDLYQRTANSLRRLLESVGIKRRAKAIGPRRPGALDEFLNEDGTLRDE